MTHSEPHCVGMGSESTFQFEQTNPSLNLSFINRQCLVNWQPKTFKGVDTLYQSQPNNNKTIFETFFPCQRAQQQIP